MFLNPILIRKNQLHEHLDRRSSPAAVNVDSTYRRPSRRSLHIASPIAESKPQRTARRSGSQLAVLLENVFSRSWRDSGASLAKKQHQTNQRLQQSSSSKNRNLLPNKESKKRDSSGHDQDTSEFLKMHSPGSSERRTVERHHRDRLSYLRTLWRRPRLDAAVGAGPEITARRRQTENICHISKLPKLSRRSLNFNNSIKEKEPQLGEDVALLCQLMLLHKLSPPQPHNQLYQQITSSSDDLQPDFDWRLDEKHFVFYPFIFQYLHDRESSIVCHKEFLTASGLCDSFRSLLVDWLVKVQVYTKCRTESLHVAVSLVDSLLAVSMATRIKKSLYQLAGLAAFLVACKVVQRGHPRLQQLCYLTEDCYTPRQLVAMEALLLKRLDFRVHVPLSTHFLHRGLLACVELIDTGEVDSLCRFLLEVGLLSAESHSLRPSCLAAASICMSRAILFPDLQQLWTRVLVHFTLYSIDALRPGIQLLASCLIKLYTVDYRFTAVLDKYSRQIWTAVAKHESVLQFVKDKRHRERLLHRLGIETALE